MSQFSTIEEYQKAKSALTDEVLKKVQEFEGGFDINIVSIEIIRADPPTALHKAPIGKVNLITNI